MAEENIINDLDFSGIKKENTIDGLDLSFLGEAPEATPERIAGSMYYSGKEYLADKYGGAANIIEKGSRITEDVISDPEYLKSAEAEMLRMAYRSQKGIDSGDGVNALTRAGFTPTNEQVEMIHRNLALDEYIKNGYSEEDAFVLAASKEKIREQRELAKVYRNAEQSKVLEAPVEFQGPSSGMIEDLARGLTQIAIDLPVYAVSPILGGASLFMGVQGNISSQLREGNPGLTEDEIFNIASTAGGLISALEMAGSKLMLEGATAKGGLRSIILKIAYAAFGGGTVEAAQEWPEMVAITAGLNPDLPADEVLSQVIFNVDSWKRSGYSGLLGMILEGAVPGTIQGTQYFANSLIHPRQQRINQHKIQRITEIVSKPTEDITTDDIKEVLTLTNQSQSKIDSVKDSNINEIVKAVKKNVLFQRELSESEGRKRIQESLRQVYKEEDADKVTHLWDAVMESAVNKGVFEDIDEAYDNLIFQKTSLKEFMQRMEEAKVNPDFQPQPLFQEGQTYENGKLNVNTPEFESWFGKSAGINEDGSPMIFYHGTASQELAESGEFSKEALLTQDAFFFSTESKIASKYALGPGIEPQEGATVYPVYLSMQNPLKADWKGQRINQDKMAELIERAKQGGYDSIISYNIVDGGTSEIQVATFEPTQIKSIFNKGSWNPEDARILYQKKEKPIGALEIDEIGKMIIHAFDGADLSTPIHETGHMIIEMMARIQDDGYFTLGNWAGVDAERLDAGYSQWTESEKEKVARAFEAYMMEGKAPSQRLRNVFAAMKSWLVEIYRSIRRLNVNINDNVRSVFDNWLASQQEIENNLFNEVPEWFNAESQNTEITIDSDYEEINQKAKEIVADKFKKRREHEEKKIGSEFKKHAEELVESEIPIYGIMNEIVESGGINREYIKRIHGQAMVENLHARRGGLIGKNGMPLDELARWFGYQDEQQLLDDILNSPSKEQFVETYVNEMWREYEIGFDHMNAEIYEEVINEEINIFSKLLKESTRKHKVLKKVETSKEKIKEFTGRPNLKRFEVEESEVDLDDAKNLKERIKEIERSAKQAFLQGKKDTTIEWKLKKKEAIAKERAKKKIQSERAKIWRRMNRHIKVSVDKLPLEYKKHVNALLGRYTKIPKSFDVGPPATDLISFLGQLKDNGEYVSELESYMRYALPEPTTKGKLDIEDLRTIASMADMIAGLGRNEGKLIYARKRRDLLEEVNKCTSVMTRFFSNKEPISPEFNNENEYYLDKYKSIANAKKAMDKIKDLFAGLKRTEFIFNAADGWNYTGERPNHDIYMMIKKANDFKLKKGREVEGNLRKLFKPFKSEWAGQQIEINWKGKKQAWPKESLILMALNDGNAGNRKAMMHGYKFMEEGQKIGRNGEELFNESMNDVWSKLNKEEKQLVYDIWDLLDSFYNDLNKVHKELTGAELQKVDGFYFPLVPNTKLTPRTKLFEELENIKDMFSASRIFHNVKAGFRIARTPDGARYAPDLSFRVIHNHIDGVLHDITHQIPIRNAKMIIHHPAYREAFIRAFGETNYNQILTWLQHVARPNRDDSSGHEWFAGKIRRNATVAALGWRVITGFKQFPSTFQTIEALNTAFKKAGIKGDLDTSGGILVAKGLGKFMTNMKDEFNRVNSMSPEMEARKYSYDRDLADLFNQMNESGIFKGKSHSIKKSFFVFIRAVDAVASYSSWLAAYDAGLQMYTDKNGTPNVDKVIEFADEIIRQTQPISFMKDLSLYQRGGKHKSNWIKLFTMFSGFFNVFYNRNVETIQRIKAKDITAGELVNIGIWRILIPSMVAAWIMRRDEWKLSDIPADTFYFIMSTIPILRDISSGLQYGRNYSLTPLGGMTETASSIVRKSYKHMFDDDYKGEPESLIKDIIRGAGYASGFPSLAAIQAFEGILDLSEGDTNNPLRLVLPEAKPRKREKKKKRKVGY